MHSRRLNSTEEYDVTDLIDPHFTQKSEPQSPEQHSPWIMLTTLLLLIGGLLFSSAILVHYGMQRRGGTSDAASGFAGLLAEGREFAARTLPQPQEKTAGEPTATAAPESLGIKKFFSGSDEENVKWPKLKLTGFGKGVHLEDGFAIINGKKVMVGGQIGDVRLVNIRTHGVLVELQGEQKTLTVEIPK